MSGVAARWNPTQNAPPEAGGAFLLSRCKSETSTAPEEEVLQEHFLRS